MTHAPAPQMTRWSTLDVPLVGRLDYWASILSSTLIPMSIDWADAHTFESQMTATQLGSVTVLNQRGSAHSVTRTRADIDRSGERSFHLLTSLKCGWTLEHRGRVRLEAGEVILTDSQYAHHLCMRAPYSFVNLKLSPDWIRTWLPQPAQLVGQRIAANSGWGRALSAYLGQLSPEFIAGAPVPLRVVEDHVGGLLALVANERCGNSVVATSPGRRALLEQIRDCITQRCNEARLTAPDIATALNISVRTLHRVLAAYGQTFGAQLLESRLELALRMLESPLFDRLTSAEIGRRAGFSEASHFTRSMRRRYGRTPGQSRMRRLRGHDGRNVET